MRRSMFETLMGAVVLAVAAIFLGFAYSSAGFRDNAGYPLSASFGRIGSVKIGSDVRVSGIDVGTVTALGLDPETYLATVSMTIDETYRFPDDTTAVIATEGMLGGNYVELVPGASPDMIASGGSIEFTQNSVDIVDLLGRFMFSADKAGERPQ